MFLTGASIFLKIISCTDGQAAAQLVPPWKAGLTAQPTEEQHGDRAKILFLIRYAQFISITRTRVSQSAVIYTRMQAAFTTLQTEELTGILKSAQARKCSH